jgi:hypothetical protein
MNARLLRKRINRAAAQSSRAARFFSLHFPPK